MIQTRGLRRTFTSRRGAVEAVAGIDLEVEAGTIFGFLGPNGAGKTTTLRMLATLLPPTGGDARVAGCDLRSEPAGVRERIGYVSQRGGSDVAVTGRREIEFQARLYGMGAAAARARTAELVTALQLEECADRRCGTYSGGQRRRLDIALGLVHRPQLLFLDEPTTGLDPQSRAHLWEEVRGLRDQGTSVFLTTHYLDEADQLCDQLTIIDHGRLVAAGTPTALKRQIAGDVITLGVGGDPAAALALLEPQPFVREAAAAADAVHCFVDHGETATPALLRLLDGAGIELRSLTLTRPSLDDVFLRQTGRRLRDEAV
ncbi:MAG TPA: ATP-binding cassette domain-containing protein [Candidatus Micrarchaeia archaeon]|nr:ATP-binding cassette domain-containing protein [Candidatus Micrarchaeia archaeon]